MKVVAFCSPVPGCGKDTVCEMMRLKRFAFADRLKQIAYTVGWDGKKDEKGRKLLIELGNAIRAYCPTYFVDFLLKEISFSNLPNDSVIGVTDLRMENEEEGLRKEFGETLMVIGVERNVDYSLATDPTQSYYASIKKDVVISNNGTKEDLKEKVKSIMEGINVRQSDK